MDTHEYPDGWADFAELLGLIRNLFGDALKASEALAPKVARSASRWLRAAEAFARVLVLMLARSVVLAPARTAGALAGQAVQAGPPRAGEAPAVPSPKRGGPSLFAFSRTARRRRAYARPEMTIEQERNWYLFGGKERAAEKRALRHTQGFPSGSPDSSRQQCATTSTDAGRMPAVPGKGVPCLPSQANLVRRYNALVRVFEAPDRAAQRLARRLAPALVARLLATASPRERWRSGYDDTIARHMRIAAVGHDSS